MRSLCFFLVLAAACAAHKPKLTAEAREAVAHISEDRLRANLSFLASDALEGRSTPSSGQNVAAEFIASRFREARLEAPVNGGYLQPVDLVRVSPNREGLSASFEGEGRSFTPKVENVTSDAALDLTRTRIYKLAEQEEPGKQLAGKVALVSMRTLREQRRKLAGAHPAAVLAMPRTESGQEPRIEEAGENAGGPAVVLVNGEEARKWAAALPHGDTQATLTLHCAEPLRMPVKTQNVIGILRGSDAKLKNEYLIVSAHYDHLAPKESGDGDRIFNGANDDGSGTVSVIELAQAFAALPVKPRRSLVFVAFCGEELGLLGSRYYGHHPVEPLAQTIAQINLEQLGRVNETEGLPAGSATFTGFEFSDLPAVFAQAGELTGVAVKQSRNSDVFFARSDNQALADLGIPAHTLAAAYDFPDYHRVSDEWQKIDFPNLAKIDAMVAAGLDALANRPEIPHWNRENKKTQSYWKAYDQMHSNAGATH